MMNTTIKSELDKLFKSSLEGNVNRASLFNLIFYTADPSRTEYFDKMIKMVSEQFPCRIFLLQGDKSISDDSLTLEVTPANHLPYDKVLIKVTGASLQKVPFLILPHLIPDLPVYLFWGQDPSKDSPLLNYLEPLATRLIFDSECTDNLQVFANTLKKKIESTSTEIIDMNWVRTAGWRQLIAQTFDSKERVDLLKKTTFVKITYNNLPNPLFKNPQTQAIYLQAWLATRLKWQFEQLEKHGDSLTIRYRNQNTSIQVQLIPQTNQQLDPEEIIECEISNSNDFEVMFARKEKNQICIKTSDQYQCALPFTLILPTFQSGRAFVQEIFYQKISSQYPAIQNLLSKVNWGVVNG